MADGERKQPDLVMWRKGDRQHNTKKAYLVAIVENLLKTDTIEVTFPTNRNDPYLRLRINDVVREKYIPNEVEKKRKKDVQIDIGKKRSEIRIKLRKKTAESWDNKWSPSRERVPVPGSALPTAAAASSGSDPPEVKEGSAQSSIAITEASEIDEDDFSDSEEDEDDKKTDDDD